MILITGATGFLGREILGRLLIHRPQEQLCVLLRSTSQFSAKQRSDQLLSEIFGEEQSLGYRSRVTTLDGDVTKNCLGLNQQDFQALAAKVGTVFHCAADTALNNSLESKRKINVGGTYQILKLAEHAAARNSSFRLCHVSTAYVAGNRLGIVRPKELDLHAKFRNAYEQTKAEAEALVRSMSDNIDIRIFRPSIIVGDSVTGETSAFNVVYIPARLLIAGLFKTLPALPYAPFDVVPVDYVADAIINLSNSEGPSGTCYHLSAGIGRESTPHEVLEMLVAAFNKHHGARKKQMKTTSFVAPELLSKAFSSITTAAAHGMIQLEKIVAENLAVFRQVLPMVPYMLSNPRFDAAETEQQLSGIMAPPPLFRNYAERLFHYCFETNWGRRPWSNPRNLHSWLNRLPETNQIPVK